MASSCIDDFEYNPKLRELTVYFVNGGSYTYSNVPRKIVEGLKNAPSQGTYFNAVIRPMGLTQ